MEVMTALRIQFALILMEAMSVSANKNTRVKWRQTDE